MALAILAEPLEFLLTSAAGIVPTFLKTGAHLLLSSFSLVAGLFGGAWLCVLVRSSDKAGEFIEPSRDARMSLVALAIVAVLVGLPQLVHPVQVPVQLALDYFVATPLVAALLLVMRELLRKGNKLMSSVTATAVPVALVLLLVQAGQLQHTFSEVLIGISYGLAFLAAAAFARVQESQMGNPSVGKSCCSKV